MPSKVLASSSQWAGPGSRCTKATAAAVTAPPSSRTTMSGRRRRVYERGAGSQPMKKSSAAGGASEEREGAGIGVSLHQSGFHGRSGRQRAGVEEDAAAGDADAIGGDALSERRRRTAVLGAVLPAVPGAG